MYIFQSGPKKYLFATYSKYLLDNVGLAWDWCLYSRLPHFVNVEIVWEDISIEYQQLFCDHIAICGGLRASQVPTSSFDFRQNLASSKNYPV